MGNSAVFVIRLVQDYQLPNANVPAEACNLFSATGAGGISCSNSGSFQSITRVANIQEYDCASQ